MKTNGAFQYVSHFHMHVYGRNKGNDIKFGYSKGLKNDLPHIARIADKIKEQLL
jgi:diadenosine tetraphosphate (Ap4A) HIT family hydrolase